MSRYPLQTVTLPILIDAETPEKAEGTCICFSSPTHTRRTSVRVINEKEVKRRLPEIFSSKEKSLTNEKFLYVGLGLLRRAFETKDEMNIKSALGKVHQWFPRIGVRSVHADANIWHLARWDYAGVMSNALQNARLVVWFQFESTRLLSPGVYCTDLKTAAYVTMVIGRH